jgi:hypothetical protein
MSAHDSIQDPKKGEGGFENEYVLCQVFGRVGRAGFEPATFRLSAERSSQAELPAHDGVDYYKPLTVFKCFRNSFNRLRATLEWARSPVWIKAPAFGAGDRGFKSPRVRHHRVCICNFAPIALSFFLAETQQHLCYEGVRRGVRTLSHPRTTALSTTRNSNVSVCGERRLNRDAFSGPGQFHCLFFKIAGQESRECGQRGSSKEHRNGSCEKAC